MLLRVTHTTRYAYTPPVKTAQHMAHLKPRDMPGQALVSHALTVSPQAAQQSEVVDVFGNVRSFFSVQGMHEELRVVARSIVRTSEPDTPANDIAWEAVREYFRYHAGAAYDPASEFLFPSTYVPRHEDFVAYARPSFSAGKPLAVAARDLMERIHADFTYDTKSTEVNTPAREALQLRKGVCQDFAHIMVACLRAMGLPARYISGYLLTEPPPGKPRLVGSDASHAWASVYLPRGDGEGHWRDFDPTNKRTAGEDYVILAIGRDYADVSPMRGVIHGGARHTLKVGVTVEPVEAIEPADAMADAPPQSQSQFQFPSLPHTPKPEEHEP